MLTIDLDSAERLVTQSNNLYWDGWTLVQLKRDPSAWLKSSGVQRNGVWYTQTRYELDDQGLYTVPKALGHGI